MKRNRYFEDEELSSTGSKTLLRILKMLRPYLTAVISSVLLLLFAAVATTLGPVLIRRAVDIHIPAGNWNGIVTTAVLFVVLMGLNALAFRYRLLIMVKTGNKVIETLRRSVFAHVQTLSFSFFDNRPAGKIIHCIMVYVDRLQQLVKHGVVNIVADVLRLALILSFMFAVSPKLALVALTVTPLLAGYVFFTKKSIRSRWDDYQAKSSNLNACLHESISGVLVTQAFVREEANSRLVADQISENKRSWMRAVNRANTLFPVVLLLNAVSTGLVYLVGFNMLESGTTTLGTIISFNMFIWMLTEPIVNLSTYYNEVLVALAAAGRVFEYLDTPPEVRGGSSCHELPEVGGAVEFRGVGFSYTPSVQIFKDLSFQVTPGESIAIVGATGAGKSTVINLLTRFYDIQSGQILIDGHDVKTVTLKSLRRQVGVMLQDPFVFSGSIADNIRYGNPDAGDDEVIAAAKTVHAHPFIENLPDKYETRLNEGGSNLSLGQKQLISFARILLADPRILVLDEATASIDTLTEQAMQTAIARVLEGRTSIVIAHRLSTIRHADRIFVIENGALVETGNHGELLESGGRYHDLYMSQMML